MVLKHWAMGVIVLHSVTREYEICGKKLERMKVLMQIERGRANRIVLSRVASIEKTSAGLVMRVLGTS